MRIGAVSSEACNSSEQQSFGIERGVHPGPGAMLEAQKRPIEQYGGEG